MRQQEDDFRSTASGFAAVVDEHGSSADFNKYITEQATIVGAVLQKQQDESVLDSQGNELAKIVYHAAAAKSVPALQSTLSEVEQIALKNLSELNTAGFVNAAVNASMYLSFNAEDNGFVEFVVDIGNFTHNVMKGKVLIMTGFEPVKPAN